VATKWFLEADFLQGCNCDYGCPCEFQAPPTMGFCESTGAWRITNGMFGDICLAGLGIAFAGSWPQAVHLGNGTAMLFVDERATPEQRDALRLILTGEAGGMPFEIIAATVSNMLPIQYVPFEFHLDRRHSRVAIGESVQIGLVPILNARHGSEENVRVVHSGGFLFRSADVVAAKTCDVKVDGLQFAWPNKAGFFAQVRYEN